MILEIVQWILIFYYIYTLSESVLSICKSVETMEERLQRVERRGTQSRQTHLDNTDSDVHVIPDIVVSTLRNEEETQNCSICTEPLVSNLTVTSCGHLFHSACIDSWFSVTGRNRSSCPMCRETLRPPQRQREHTVTTAVAADPGSGMTTTIDIMAFLPRNRDDIIRILNRE